MDLLRASGALEFRTMTSHVQTKSWFPSVPPDLHTERVAVSSCCEEVTLLFKVSGGATSGEAEEVRQDACRPRVQVSDGKRQL